MEKDQNLNKQSFGAYFVQKRRQAGLTQEELAKRLFVTNTTVSKWERGLSYPDIALVTDICRELSISEHEFFTACDDVAAGREKKDAKVYRVLHRRVQQIFTFCYVVTLIICFLCNLAVYHTLSWFWIVLTALLLAFSFTNVPLMTEKETGVVTLGCATGSLFLLLLACWGYTRGAWLGFGIAVSAVCLALPWGLYLLGRFCPRHRGFPAIVLAAITGWNVLLVILCVAVTSGGNLFRALLITGISYLPVWGIFAIAVYVPLHRCLKGGLICFLSDFSIPFMELSLNALMINQDTNGLRILADYFQWGRLFQQEYLNVNLLVFALGFIASALVTIVGVILQLRGKKREKQGMIV